MNHPLRTPPLARVRIDDTFWAPRMEINRRVTLPVEYRQLKDTGRIDAFRLDWQPGRPNRPHQFWDSDVAKWIEAAGYSLATHPDPDLEALVDGVIDLIAAAQQSDGYLNVYYTVVEPGRRWTNLRDMHELYCAGHLMEAAVAYYEGTGKRRLLDVMCRYADHIASVFGPGEGQRRGYPGHEEIELALVKLYRATGEKRYLDLAAFFINERGSRPHYYDLEAEERGEDPAAYRFRDYSYNQSHLPVREQTDAVGHAVRAMYLYSGMADVAAETGDESLLAACERLWESATRRRMYVTGGIGSTAHGERFTYDYDLPNATAYAETCAAIGLVFWASRMLQISPRGEYADVMERALYNGVLSGISLDGRQFFYANPLEVNRRAWEALPEDERPRNTTPVRQDWFGCACCPPNIARLLASLGKYVYSQGKDTAWVHLYIAGSVQLHLDGLQVGLRQETDYPWDGGVVVHVDPQEPAEFTLALRIPGWCREPRLTMNGEDVALADTARDGYAHLTRRWAPGDSVALTLPMPAERVHAHPEVRDNAGRVALQRGPLVYCLEEHDNVENLHDVSLPEGAVLTERWDADLLGGVMTLAARAHRSETSWWTDALYRKGPARRKSENLIAIPYYAWANRGLGSMLVWIREGDGK